MNDHDPGASAGLPRWPQSRSELTRSDLCPACFQPLSSPLCATCGLDLAHPAAAELFEASLTAAVHLDRRRDIIARIRADAATASPVGGGVRSPALRPPLRETGARPARRWPSVQLVLLVVGVSLLSIGAVAFLVYAFLTYGIVWRSVIVAAATAAAFAIATLLRRRPLLATSEGVAVFASVLVYLDAGVVRAEDFFGAGAADAGVYRGGTIVLAAVGFLVWHRYSGLLAPRVIGLLSLAPGAGMIVHGLARTIDEPVRLWLAFAATAAAGMVHRLADRLPGAIPPGVARAERHVALGVALTTLTAAMITAATLEPVPGVATTAVVATVVVTGIAGVHLVLIRPTSAMVGSGSGSARLWGQAFAVVASVGLSTAGVAIAWHAGSPSAVVVAPVVVAAAVALALEASALGASDPYVRAVVTPAYRVAAGIAAVALAVPSAAAVGVVRQAVGRGVVDAWTLRPQETVVEAGGSYPPSILALLVVTLLVGLSVVLTGRFGGPDRSRRSDGRLVALAWLSAGVLLVAVPLLETLVPMLIAWFSTAGAALLALAVLTRRSRSGSGSGSDVGRRLHRPAGTLFGLGIAVTWLLSWASTSTWPIVSAATIAIVLVARRAVVRAASRAALLGVAAVVGIVASAASARLLALPAEPGVAWIADPLRTASAVAILLLAGAVVITRRGRLREHPPASSGPSARDADRHVVFWIGLSTVAVAESALGALRALPAPPVPAELLPPPAVLLLHGVLVASLLLRVVLPSAAPFRLQRAAASVALAPAVYLLAASFAGTVGATAWARSVAPMTAALLAAAASLVVALLRPDAPISRPFREIGIVAVAVPAVVTALVVADPALWLVLLLGAVTAGMTAVGPDGPPSADSPRRIALGGALVLAAAALGARLAGDPVPAVERYVLPVAGLLLLVAPVARRVGIRRRPADARGDHASPAIALAGLLVAILPVAANRMTGDPVPALVVGALAAGLLLLGCLARPGTGTRPYLDAAALAGGAGVVVVFLGRAVVLAGTRPASAELDGWLAAALVVVLVAAVGLAASSGDRSSGGRAVLARALVIGTLTAAFLIEAVVLVHGDSPAIRPVSVVLVLAAVHVLASLVDRAPLTWPVAWSAAGCAAATAAIAGGLGSVEPIEAVSVPLAAALLATGAVHLRREARARSWPWLGPGTAVLLLPSLIATVDDRPLWRLVVLGVVGVVIVAVAAVRRLQGPFVIAAAVLLVHAIATFSPQLQAIYESVVWWLWLVIGGTALIALAARFERRLHDVKDIAARIGSLR